MKYSVKFQCDNGGFSIGRYSGFLGVSEENARSSLNRDHPPGALPAGGRYFLLGLAGLCGLKDERNLAEPTTAVERRHPSSG